MAEARLTALAVDGDELLRSVSRASQEPERIPAQTGDYDDKAAALSSTDSKEDVAADRFNSGANKLANEISWQVDDIPLKYRCIAFVFIMLFSTGAALAEATLGPLKSTLVKELDLTS